MKTSTVVILLMGWLSLTTAQAQQPAAPSAEGFETRKQEALSNLDKRMALLQEAKTCIAGAADLEALKKCHQASKEDRLEMRHDRMEKKMHRQEMRKQKAQENH